MNAQPEHLIPTQTDRGFAWLPALSGAYGGTVTTYESSAASGPHVWLKAVNDDGREATMHLDAETAWKLSDQLRTLVTNHYQGDATPAWARKD